MMTGRQITTALKGRWHGSYGMASCPSHPDGKTPALKISDDPRKSDGIDLHCFGGCDWRDVKAELRRRGLLPERDGTCKRSWRRLYRPSHPAQAIREPDNDTKGRTAAARRIWSETRAASDSPVETYLASRGITIPPPATLRHHPGLKAGPTGSLHPAMVGAVTVWPRREVVAVHRTVLKADGSGKAPVTKPKMMLGPCAGGAVRLSAAGDNLVLAEGIETALSILQATGKPTWACLSVTGIKSVILPPQAKSIIIAADGDKPEAKAAKVIEDAAARLLREGCEVKIAKPPLGMDFNDLLMLPENVIPFPGHREATHG